MTVLIQVFLPEALRDAIDSAAKAKGLSRSAWIRAAVAWVLATQERKMEAGR